MSERHNPEDRIKENVAKLSLNLTNEQKALIKRIITRVPRNEEEVKRIFYKLEDTLGFQNVRTFISFPDATAYYEDKEINIEFEYRSSNFKRHGHKEKDCDLIVCWEDDDSSLEIHVLELSTLAENWLDMRREIMMDYVASLSKELSMVEGEVVFEENSKETERIASLMEKYNFNHDDAIAESMCMTKAGLYYNTDFDDPECAGGPLECEKRDIDPKYLGIDSSSLKVVPLVLCKKCANRAKCRWEGKQIGYYFLLKRNRKRPRKVGIQRIEIKDEKILPYAKLPQMNLWKAIQFRRR